MIALSGVLSRRLSNQIPSEEFSYLEIIERNGKHLPDLINDIFDILDISRIEAGREELEITHFRIDQVVADVVSMINPQAAQKCIELIQAPVHGELFITNDEVKFRHHLQNLASNAVKFTEIGKVEIETEQTDQGIAIAVADTGVGISPDHMDHIYDEFRQADGSTSRRFRGTCLGLAIAKKYAHLLGFGFDAYIAKPIDSVLLFKTIQEMLYGK